MMVLWIVSSITLAVAGAFGILRIFQGPDPLDRALGLDFLSLTGVAILALISAQTREPRVLDGALLFALVGFLSALAFARYLTKGDDE
jgi:multisubunit Na+/H+ antiporter MnhF subunit